MRHMIVVPLPRLWDNGEVSLLAADHRAIFPAARNDGVGLGQRGQQGGPGEEHDGANWHESSSSPGRRPSKPTARAGAGDGGDALVAPGRTTRLESLEPPCAPPPHHAARCPAHRPHTAGRTLAPRDCFRLASGHLTHLGLALAVAGGSLTAVTAPGAPTLASVTTPGITGGVPDGTAHPYVAMIVPPGASRPTCSGVLVRPTMGPRWC